MYWSYFILDEYYLLLNILYEYMYIGYIVFDL